MNLNDDEILNECLSGLNNDLENFSNKDGFTYDQVVEDQYDISLRYCCLIIISF